MKLFAGTSGYGFREWVGTFYPEKTKPADFLSYYSSVFRSVEVNHTFRRFPKPELAASWAASTPDVFRFAIKAHQGITHRARLADTEESVIHFLKALEPLGDRLGPVLFQCPPWFRRDDDRLESFLESLPREAASRSSFGTTRGSATRSAPCAAVPEQPLSQGSRISKRIRKSR